MSTIKSILVYAAYIPKVGGIETITYNLTKALAQHGYELTLVVNSCEQESGLFKFAPYCNVVFRDRGAKIKKADVCLITSNHRVPRDIQADRYIQWIHSDYRKYNIKMANLDRQDMEYVAVSNHCSQVAKEMYNIDSTPILNFPDHDFQWSDKPLRLVTVSRLSPEKGMERMVYLANKLKELGVKFLWTVCGDSPSLNVVEKWEKAFRNIEEVSFVGYKHNPAPYIAESDYTVLLSDFEGCPMALLESIKLGIPVITTNWGGSDEIVREGETGYIVPLDITKLEDRKIMEIANNIPKIAEKDKNFTEKCVDQWIKFIDK